MASKHILLVDEEPARAELLGAALRAVGYETSYANSMQEGILSTAKTSFDLIVADFGTNSDRGRILGILLRDQLGVPFVLLSTAWDEATVRQAATTGTMVHMLRPSDPRDCIPVINVAIARADEFRLLRERVAQLSTALEQTRATSMAVGVLVERLRLNRESAFAALRDRARKQRRRVTEVAEAILESVECIDGLRDNFRV
jgi:two-component system, response regulator PdtaR